MDQVLCIDISVEPARVVLTSVEGNKLSVIASQDFSLEGALDLDKLLRNRYVEKKQFSDSVAGEMPGEDSGEAEPANSIEIEALPIAPMVEAIERLPKTWVNSVLIIPMTEYLSLNITLPFADQKNILKIIDFEVQDLVPFEIDEFAIEGHAISTISENQHDVHVSLAPRLYIANILTLCRASGIEPSIVTTPCSGLANLPLLAPDYFKDSFALISVGKNALHLCTSFDGEVRSDKVIPLSPAATIDTSSFLSELKMALMSSEKKYNRTLANVYIEGSAKIVSELQQKLGRAVENLSIADFVTSSDQRVASSALPALFASDEVKKSPLTNFRVREFAFRPNWAALGRMLLSLRYYFAGACALMLCTVFFTYQARQLQIARLESALREKIRTTIPTLKGGEGNEVPAFRGELLTLTKELESIGSSNEISPINILIELTKDLSSQSDTTINQIDIRPDRVLLDISVPDYAAADRIERVLKRKKDLFRRIRKDAASYSSASGGRNFNFELKLYD